MSGFSTGSEPWLRDDESVCPVTGYTYLTSLGESPYIKELGLVMNETEAPARDADARKYSAANA
ncbi:MAG: hypothetical protein ACRCZD_12620 [Phycicoccus sp.]